MAISIQALAGHIHELVVLVALRAGPQHGYQIARTVRTRSRGSLDLQLGTLYPILHRLEKRHLVRSTWSGPEGRPRRVYTITHAGASHLRQEAGTLRHTFDRLLACVTDDSPVHIPAVQRIDSRGPRR